MTPRDRRSARLTYVSGAQAEKESAERFVLEQLARYRDGVKSTGLRELAKGKHSGEEIAEAVKSLAARGVIAFRPGPRGAKLWALTAPAEDVDDDLEMELERYEQTREGNT